MKICVVHLVRVHNELSAFENFVNSYKNFNAGMPHDLVVVFKGFNPEDNLEKYRKILEGINYQTLMVSDEGYDITAYSKAAIKLNYEYFVFFNSFSEILAEDWLAKMYSPFLDFNAGLVGATGSFQSVFTDYASILPYERFRRRVKKERPLWKTLIVDVIIFSRLCLDYLQTFNLIKHFSYYSFLKKSFPPYPNCHIRSNAFLVTRKLFLKAAIDNYSSKFNAYKFESGKNSLTNVVLAEGKNIFLVDRNGSSYQKNEWPSSNIFWQGEQENLLIADNQTRSYANGDSSVRLKLRTHAWGDATN